MADGMLVEVQVLDRGTAASADAAVGATTITVEDTTQFDPDGGTLSILGVTYDFTAVDEDVSTITLASALTVAVDEFDPVVLVVGGEAARDWLAVVDLGGGDSTSVPLPYTMRAVLPEGAYDPPVPVKLADDYSAVLSADRGPTIGSGNFDLGAVAADDISFNAFGGSFANAIPDPHFRSAAWRERRAAASWSFLEVTNLLTSSGWVQGAGATSLTIEPSATPGAFDAVLDVAATTGQDLVATPHVAVTGGRTYAFAVGLTAPDEDTVEGVVEVFDSGGSVVYDEPESMAANSVTIYVPPTGVSMAFRASAQTNYTGPVRISGLYMWDESADVQPPQFVARCVAPDAGTYDLPLVTGVPLAANQLLGGSWGATAVTGTPETHVVLTYHFPDGSSQEYLATPEDPSLIYGHHWNNTIFGPYTVPLGAVSVDASLRVVATAAGDEVRFSHARLSPSGFEENEARAILQPDEVWFGDFAQGAEFHLSMFEELAYMWAGSWFFGFDNSGPGLSIYSDDTGHDSWWSPEGVVTSAGAFTIPAMCQAGHVTITPTAANTPTSVSVTFAVPFDAAPAIQVTPRTITPGPGIAVSYSNVTATGFDVYLTRSTVSATTISWQATAETQ